MSINYLIMLIFSVGVFGFILNTHNLIKMLISVEIMLISAASMILHQALVGSDLSGAVMVLFILAFSAAKVALGLVLVLQSKEVNLWNLIKRVDFYD